MFQTTNQFWPFCTMLHSYGKSPCLMGISSINLAVSTTIVTNYRRVENGGAADFLAVKNGPPTDVL